MLKYVLIFTILVTTFYSYVAQAQGFQGSQHPVYLMHTGNDRTGAIIVSNIRQAVQSNPRLMLTSNINQPHYTIYVVSMPIHVPNSEASSVFSISFTHDSADGNGDRFLTSVVGQCSHSIARGCAENYVSDLFTAIDYFQRQTRN